MSDDKAAARKVARAKARAQAWAARHRRPCTDDDDEDDTTS
jgi:hypothetical protein